MNTPTKRSTTKRLQQASVLLILIAGLVACASAPLPPTSELQAAELAIASAEQDQVANYALPELNDARKKLDAARIAVSKEDMKLATYLATESEADAQLASARAEMLKAKAVNDEMQKSIDTLKIELQRNSGARQ
jgi:ribosome-associated translation inhibitor RaiA